jgi:hypothetical protein
MICPKCGYEEAAPWKNSPHQLFMQYLSPEEALEFVPEILAAAKLNPKYTEDQQFAYRLTKVGFLHRQPRVHCFNKKWTNYSSCYEKHRKKDRFQLKLTVGGK